MLIWLLISLVLLCAAWMAGRRLGICLCALVLCTAVLWDQRRPSETLFSVPQTAPMDSYTTSVTCRGCHPRAWKTWSDSYHKSMTQRPNSETVLGQFNLNLEHQGVVWRPFTRDGRYFARWQLPNGEQKTAEITLLTGSHHLQNYWMALKEGWLIQMPWAWWIKAKRWIPVSQSFLRPPPQGPEPPTVWNDSCVYCHTTGGIRGAPRDATLTSSKVVELGIACESCHGPAGAHRERNGNPVDRYTGHLRGSDPTIINPTHRPQESNSICGQCHGVFAHLKGAERDLKGDPYRPGDDLARTRIFLRPQPSVIPGRRAVLSPRVSNAAAKLMTTIGPIQVELTGIAPDGIYCRSVSVPAGPVSLSMGREMIRGHWHPLEGGGMLSVSNWSPITWRRALDRLGFQGVQLTRFDWDAFWDDGTVRTVGREYNGLVISPCASKGKLQCTSCHEMHGSDPENQLKPGHDGDHACAECHRAYVGAPDSHTHHGETSSGSRCQNCHMPHTTYGLLGVARAHRIDSPAPAFMWSRGRPNACNLCHLDKTISWAQGWVSKWYGTRAEPAPLESASAKPASVAAGPLWLLTGDAAVRAVTTWHLGWAPSRTTGKTDLWAGPYLRRLALDDYAAVRAVVEQVLKVQPWGRGLKYDFTKPRSLPPVTLGPLDGIADPRALLITGDLTFQEARAAALMSIRSRRPVTIAE